MGGISIWQLLIIALIVLLLFGTNKLRTLGSDLGSAIKGFRKAMEEEGQEDRPKDGFFSEEIIKDKVLKNDIGASKEKNHENKKV